MAEASDSCQLFDFVVCAVLIGVICVGGLVGNALAFLVLCKHKTETSAIYLLQCMAVADSVLLVTTLLIYSIPAMHPYSDSDLEELFSVLNDIKIYVWPLAMMTHTVTIYLTVLVTLNRFCAVCRPMGSFRKQDKGVRLQVLGIVVFSVLYNLPRFFEHQPLRIGTQHVNATAHDANGTLQNVTIQETFNLGDSQVYQIIYSNILYFPVMYIVPLLSLGYLNVRLIRSLKAIREKKETLTGHKPKEDHITVCIVVIVCVFIICQTPALANQIFYAVLDNSGRACGRFHFYYTKLSDALVVLNSSCNFVIYCLFGKTFRTIFLDTLSCGRRKARENDDGMCLDGNNKTTNGEAQKRLTESRATPSV